jgi:hypothetical protein
MDLPAQRMPEPGSKTMGQAGSLAAHTRTDNGFRTPSNSRFQRVKGFCSWVGCAAGGFIRGRAPPLDPFLAMLPFARVAPYNALTTRRKIFGFERPRLDE